MSTSTQSAPREDGIVWAICLASFAAVLMVVNGVWAVLVGIAALVRDEGPGSRIEGALRPVGTGPAAS